MQCMCTVLCICIHSFFSSFPTVSVPSFGQKSSSFHGSHAGRDPLPPPLPPANKPMQMDSSSTASSIVTMARNTSDTHVNGGTSHTSKPKKGLFGFGRKVHACMLEICCRLDFDCENVNFKFF